MTIDKLKLYVVTKSSTSGNFKNGDLIWLSENGDLNNAMAGGWLSEDEWNVKGENDFECEISDEYYLDEYDGREFIRKR